MSTSEVITENETSRAARRLHSSAGPTYTSPGRSAANHVVIVVVIFILATVAGGVLGVRKAPVYKAQARLVVGKTANLTNLAAIAGLATAGDQIAADYSRLVGTENVSADVAHRLGHAATGSLTASPVVGSPVVLVEATGADPGSATALATAGSQALVDAVAVVNQQTTAANDSLTQQYRSASQTLEQDTQTVSQVRSQIAALQGAIGAKPANPAQQAQLAMLNQQLVSTSAAVDTDKLKTSTLENQYQAAASPSELAAQVLTPLGPAAPQGNDRKSNFEIGIIAGAVGGLVVGIAVASVVDIIRGRRRARRPA